MGGATLTRFYATHVFLIPAAIFGAVGIRMKLQFTWEGCDSALAAPLILESLRKLEYRGYDSAGIAVVDEARVRVVDHVAVAADGRDAGAPAADGREDEGARVKAAVLTVSDGVDMGTREDASGDLLEELLGKVRERSAKVGYATVYGVEAEPAAGPSLTVAEGDAAQPSG